METSVDCTSPYFKATHHLAHPPVPILHRSAVSMNTKYTVAAGVAKKKNPKSGRGELLKGYTVGSLAPPGAIASGTRISDVGTGYGISRRFGGKVNGKKVSESSEESAGGSNAALVFSVLSATVLLFANAAPQ